jgi:hypothetical protein
MKEPHRSRIGWVGIVLTAVAEYTNARVDQEQTEANEHVVKSFDNGDTQQNKYEAHNQGTEYAPEQCAVLVFARHLEVGEDHRPNEYIVDAEAFFNEIATDVLDCGCPLEHPPDNKGKTNTNSNPYGRLDGRFFYVRNVRPAMDDQNVEQQQRTDDAKQHVPPPGGNGDIYEIFSSATRCYKIEHAEIARTFRVLNRLLFGIC